MIKVEAIIFDMDGVLMDTERIAFQSYQKAFKEYKYMRKFIWGKRLFTDNLEKNKLYF